MEETVHNSILKFPEPDPMQVPGGAAMFQRIYTRLGCHGRPPHFVVEFHPYANLVHTVRLREDTAHVRVSDILRGASFEVIEAAAAILAFAAVPAARTARTCGRLSPLLRIEKHAPPRDEHAQAPRPQSENRSTGRGVRSRANVFRDQSNLFRRAIASSTSRMEFAFVARATWLLRSRRGTNCAESAPRSRERSAIRGGICAVSRDAPREASDPRRRLRIAGALRRIPPRRAAICIVQIGDEIYRANELVFLGAITARSDSGSVVRLRVVLLFFL